MAEFGFIIAATLGATAGTTDLTDGMFRHLVITGRSRVALYLARIPAGLSILLPLAAVAFAIVCLVTGYAGTPQPAIGWRQRDLRPGPAQPGAAQELDPAASTAVRPGLRQRSSVRPAPRPAYRSRGPPTPGP